MPISEDLKAFLDNPTYNTENMKKLFSNRELYKKLSTNLTEKDKKEKKTKI